MKRRWVSSIFVVLWVYLVLATNWLVEPDVAVRLAAHFPILEMLHKALWPFVHRPYIF